jgi:hypothetical protein
MLEKSILQRIFIAFIFVVLSVGTVFAQGNGFNFQGRLNDGTNPANGRYDLQFRLYDAIAGGNPIGAVLSRPNTTLINGVFSVTLDFGTTAFNSPNSIFIEIALRPNGSPNAYTILGPRQQLTVVPFAVRAANATNADTAALATNAQHSVDAQFAVNATNAGTATNSLSLGGVAPAGWARLNVPNTGDLVTTGRLQITGDATQLGTANGFVKAMAYVSANGTIIRCYNGITGTSTGTCGFTVTTFIPGGTYRIDFGFRVDDRFVAVTTVAAPSVNILTSFSFFNFPNVIDVSTNITDVDRQNSYTPNPFMIVVY